MTVAELLSVTGRVYSPANPTQHHTSKLLGACLALRPYIALFETCVVLLLVDNYHGDRKIVNDSPLLFTRSVVQHGDC